jgi:hypothetical protein
MQERLSVKLSMKHEKEREKKKREIEDIFLYGKVVRK